MQIAYSLIADRLANLLQVLVEQNRTPADVVAHHNIVQLPKVLAAVASGSLTGAQAIEFVDHVHAAVQRDTQYFGRRRLVSDEARLQYMQTANPGQRARYLAQIYFAAFALEFLNVIGCLSRGYAMSTPASAALSQWLPIANNVELGGLTGAVALCRLSRHITIPAHLFQGEVATRAPQVVAALRQYDWLAALAGSQATVGVMQLLQRNSMYDEALSMYAQQLADELAGYCTRQGVILPQVYPAEVGGQAQAVPQVNLQHGYGAPVAQAAPVAPARRALPTAVTVFVVTEDNEVILLTRPGSATHGFPGGKVEDGETPIEAAVREIEEELDIEIEAEELITVYSGVCRADQNAPNAQDYWTIGYLLETPVDLDDIRTERGIRMVLADVDDRGSILENSAFPEYNAAMLDAIDQYYRR